MLKFTSWIAQEGANQQKRELFISVVCCPSGNCYMSNVTVIPSGDDPIFLTYLLAIANVLTVIFSSCPVREGMGVPIYYSVHFSKAIW